MKTTRKAVSRIRPAVLVLTLAAVLAVPLNGAENPFRFYPDPGSVSNSDDAFAPLINPVFADLAYGSSIAYRYISGQNGNMERHNFLASLFGISFGYAWNENIMAGAPGALMEGDANLFSLSKGFFINDVAGFGAGYSFSRSGNDYLDGYRSWHFGFLLRPASFVSFGLSMRDLWSEIGGESLNRFSVFSLSLRPFGSRYTFSVDAERFGRQGAGDMLYRFSASARLMHDISLLFSSDTDMNMVFGLTVPLLFRTPAASTMEISSYMSSMQDSDTDYYSLGLSYPLAQNKKAFIVTDRPGLLRIRIAGTLPETRTRSLFSRRKPVFHDLINSVRRAADDRSIQGIVLLIENNKIGFAQIQELREEIKNFRSAGKKVYAVMTSPGNMEYYLASAANRIYFTPSSSFYLNGLSARVYFIKGLLDRAGIRFESVRRGKYKSAYESFTREGISDEFRKNLFSLISDLNKQYVNDIAGDREVPVSAVNDIFKRGPVSPELAVKLGFVDRVAYQDDALNHISGKRYIVECEEYMREQDRDPRWGPVPEIAVVHVSGNIVRGKSSVSPIMRSTGDETLRQILERVFRSDRVSAVVIRINSGGGSAVASDFMWNDLVKLKKKYKKPVVFSFGNIAASGGYYIACTGDTIFAERGTVTGSIGVIAGKISLQELYSRLGINRDVISMSEFADIYTESRDLTERERKALQSGVDFIYDRFTGRVMKARKIKSSGIEAVAEGRVFNGRQAREQSLVDQTGGLLAAIEYARSKAGLGDRYEVAMYPDEFSLPLKIQGSEEMRMVADYLKPLIQYARIAALRQEHALYITPLRIEIE